MWYSNNIFFSGAMELALTLLEVALHLSWHFLDYGGAQCCRHAAKRAGHAVSSPTIEHGALAVSLRMSAPQITAHGLSHVCALGTRLLCKRICA